MFIQGHFYRTRMHFRSDSKYLSFPSFLFCFQNPGPATQESGKIILLVDNFYHRNYNSRNVRDETRRTDVYLHFFSGSLARYRLYWIIFWINFYIFSLINHLYSSYYIEATTKPSCTGVYNPRITIYSNCSNFSQYLFSI